MVKNLPANAGDMQEDPTHLMWEDPTYLGAIKLMHHIYWACALEPESHNCWTHVLQLLKPKHPEPMFRNKGGHHNEKAMHLNQRVAPASHN